MTFLLFTPTSKRVGILLLVTSNCFILIDCLVSQRLFGDGGIARKLREHTRGIGMSEDTTSHKQPCSIEYLTVRLTHVELLLGARDDHLHPSLKDVSRKIIECKFAFAF